MSFRRLLPLGLLVASFGAHAGEAPKTTDALPVLPFKEVDVIDYKSVDKLKDFLPAPFWENREFFFYEGMELEIGPTQGAAVSALFERQGLQEIAIRPDLDGRDRVVLSRRTA